ncbi:MAG TPA: hypothetical protein VGO42_18705, partial [Reyranella sp.]|nr:hypothetical protein [Reyranella sp.]
MDEPTAGKARCAGSRRRARRASRSVDVDEHHADPFSTKVGRHTPQHCSVLSSASLSSSGEEKTVVTSYSYKRAVSFR